MVLWQWFPANGSLAVVPCRLSRGEVFGQRLPRARSLKHLLEAEKSNFREDQSFQRSECTAGLILQQFELLLLKTILSERLRKFLIR
jgi:hypothetical protein